jgi:hypothetical protein
MKGKKGIAISVLLGWIIGIAILAIILVFAVLLKDQLSGMVGYIKNLFIR